MFQIGPYRVVNQTVLAPMAGISDQPFRSLCSELGAGMVISEMVTSDTRLWTSQKSRKRLQGECKSSPRVVQIAGNDAAQMANAAREAVRMGAQIIDINMGCPAKKVCNKAAGSALLRDESLVADILQHVVASVSVPVTLKTRTGWCEASRNAVSVARIAEQAGIAALTLHGRTRACRFNGQAEYDTIAAVVDAVAIPVIANGDIDTPQKAQAVLEHTKAAAVMIGRAARGNPWIFQQVAAFLQDGVEPPLPSLSECLGMIKRHLLLLHEFYGETMGVRIARKHIAWYVEQQCRIESVARELHQWRRSFNQLNQREEQINAVCHLFERLHQLEDQAA